MDWDNSQPATPNGPLALLLNCDSSPFTLALSVASIPVGSLCEITGYYR